MNTTSYTTDEFYHFANELADVAASITLPYFSQEKTVEIKADNSPVTIADKQCEQKLRQLIANHYPTHSIIGEEYQNLTHESPFQWVIDPIDGTKSFISGNPHFGTLIALLYYEKPIVNIIDMPALPQRFSATADSHCFCNDKIVQTSKTRELHDATIAWTDDDYFMPAELAIACDIKANSKDFFDSGDCHLFTELACGNIDLVIEAGLKPWDYMALILIVERAGGVITDWHNNPLTLQSFKDNRGQVLASANETLHQQALTLIHKNY